MTTILEWTCSWIEDATSQEEIRDQLVTRRQRVAALVEGSAAVDPAVLTDLSLAADLMDRCPGLPPWEPPAILGSSAVVTPIAAQGGAPLEWLAGLPDGRVIRRHIVQKDAGRMLDALDQSQSVETRPAIQGCLEHLLRHVEVRREKALQRFSPGVTSESERWMQIHDVAILFARHARRAHDVRFLNGALKLNDRGVAAHRRRIDPVVEARFVLSLAEQEFSFLEWCPPCV